MRIMVEVGLGEWERNVVGRDLEIDDLFPLLRTVKDRKSRARPRGD